MSGRHILSSSVTDNYVKLLSNQDKGVVGTGSTVLLPTIFATVTHRTGTGGYDRGVQLLYTVADR